VDLLLVELPAEPVLLRELINNNSFASNGRLSKN
jgi:hypothetical protein